MCDLVGVCEKRRWGDGCGWRRGDLVYHVRNWANTHRTLCEDDEDFDGRTPIDVMFISAERLVWLSRSTEQPYK